MNLLKGKMKGRKIVLLSHVKHSKSAKPSTLAIDSAPVYVGGVVRVELKRSKSNSSKTQYTIVKAKPTSKRSIGVFVAGGKKVDEMVALANLDHASSSRKAPIPVRSKWDVLGLLGIRKK